MRATLGITIGLIVVGVVSLIMIPIYHALKMESILLLVSIILGISSYIYFNKIFPYFTFIVPPDKAWIISDPFRSENSEQRSTFSGYREIKAQIEFQAGLHWRYPQEKPHLEVDMSRQTILQNRPDEVYTLSDSNQVIIRWRIFYGPLPGNVVNFIKTRPENISQRVRDRVEKFLQSVVGEVEVIGYGRHQLELFKEKFELLYKGPSYIDDEERELGIWTGTPEIIDIDEPRNAQEIRAILKTAQEAVNESKGKMTFEEARGIILASKISGSNVDVMEFARNKAIIK